MLWILNFISLLNLLTSINYKRPICVILLSLLHSNLFPANKFRHNLIKITLIGHSLFCSVLITVFGESTFLIPVLEQHSSKTTHINHCCAPGFSGGVGTSWITFQASDPFYIWVFLFSQLSIRNDANGQFRSCFRLICLDKTKAKPVAPSCVTLCYIPFNNKFKA